MCPWQTHPSIFLVSQNDMPRRCSSWRSKEGAVDAVTADLDRFQSMLDESEDLKRFVGSPVFSAEDQTEGHRRARLQKAGIGGLVRQLPQGRGA